MSGWDALAAVISCRKLIGPDGRITTLRLRDRVAFRCGDAPQNGLITHKRQPALGVNMA